MFKFNSVLILFFSLISYGFASTEVYVYPVDSKGSIGQTILIQTVYGYHIFNDTGHVRHYTGYEELKVDDQKWIRRINFYLKPNERRDAREFGNIHYKANVKGSYPIDAYIEIRGEDGNFKRGQAILTVTDR